MIAKTIPSANGWCRADGAGRYPFSEPPGELLAHQQLDRAVELAGEPRRRVLANLAHPLVERRRRQLGVALDLALGDALEPLGLAPLELDQRQLEPGARIRLGLLDALGDRRLPDPQALGDLLHRAAALDRVRLELVERLGDGGGRCPLELLAEAHDRPPLLVARRPELRCLALDPRLDVGDRLLLPLGEAGELRLEVALGAVEIVGDSLQPLVEPSLDVGERVRRGLRSPAARARRRSSGRSSPSRRSSAASCDTVSARSRAMRAADLLDVRGRLLTNGRLDLGAGIGDDRVGLGRPLAGAPEDDPEDDRGDDRDGQARGEDPDDHDGNAIGGTRPAQPRSGSSRRQAASALPRAPSTSVSRVIASRPPPASSSSPVDGDDLPAASPHRSREPALGEREDGRPRRRRSRSRRERSRHTRRRP